MKYTKQVDWTVPTLLAGFCVALVTACGLLFGSMGLFFVAMAMPIPLFVLFASASVESIEERRLEYVRLHP